MAVTHEITLDVAKQRMRLDQRVHVRTGDKSSQTVRCALTKDGTAYTPASGTTAYLEVLKPDGMWTKTSASVSGSIVSGVVPLEAMSVPGECRRAYFRLVSGSTEDTTEDFYLYVYQNATQAGPESAPFTDQIAALMVGLEQEFRELSTSVESGLEEGLRDVEVGLENKSRAVDSQIAGMESSFSALVESFEEMYEMVAGGHFKFADPIEWSISSSYEQLTAVKHNGFTYLSKKSVPANTAINNSEYWLLWADPNAQMAELRTVVETYDTRIKTYGNETNNPIYYGADSSGIVDSSDAINACIDANGGGTVIFSPGTYKITAPIVTPHVKTKRVSIDFNGATIISSGGLEYVIGVGENQTDGKTQSGLVNKTVIKNGTIEASNADIGIRIAEYCKNVSIEKMNIIGGRVGVSCGDPGSPIDTQITDSFILYDDMTVDSMGIILGGTDSKLNNLRIYGFKRAICSRRGGNFIDNVHAFPTGNPSAAVAMDGCFVYSENGSTDQITNCACDSYSNFLCFADGLSDVNVAIINNTMTNAYTNFRMVFVNANNIEGDVRGIVSGNRITLAGNNSHYGILLSSTNPDQKSTNPQTLIVNNNRVNLRGGATITKGDLILAGRQCLKNQNHATLQAGEGVWLYLGSLICTNGYEYGNFDIEIFRAVATSSKLKYRFVVQDRSFSATRLETGSAIYKLGANVRSYGYYRVVDLYIEQNTGSIRLPTILKSEDVQIASLPNTYDYILLEDAPSWVES